MGNQRICSRSNKISNIGYSIDGFLHSNRISPCSSSSSRQQGPSEEISTYQVAGLVNFNSSILSSRLLIRSGMKREDPNQLSSAPLQY